MELKEIGALLKEARKSKKRKLKKASQALNIKQSYLEAIEEGNLDKVSDKIYPIGYIKSYATWLGVDVDDAVKSIKSDMRPALISSRSNYRLSRKMSAYFFGKHSKDMPVIFPRLSILIFALITSVTVYLGWYYGIKMPSIEKEAIHYTSKKAEVRPTWGKEAVETSVVLPRYSVDFSKGNYVLFANKPLTIHLFDKKQQPIEEKALAIGDVFFVTRQVSYITTTHPADVEVYGGADMSKYIGVLSDLIIK